MYSHLRIHLEDDLCFHEATQRDRFEGVAPSNKLMATQFARPSLQSARKYNQMADDRLKDRLRNDANWWLENSFISISLARI
jgi:hypothetical protein